jgi:phytoene synthase
MPPGGDVTEGTAAPASEAVRAAYRRCEEITWTQARNFSYGIRLLPPAKRHALSAVYAFARRVDDIGDGSLPVEQKVAGLAQARATLTGLMAGDVDPEDQVLVALADAAGRFDIPLAAFGELIDGCEADVRGTTYRTFDDLLHYCRCVAGSIGRLSLGVFGTRHPDSAVPLADSLGVALQLTNILRDIREDFASGRVYLPAEDLERFGCTLTAEPAAGPEGGRLAELVEFEANRARGWYAQGLTLMPLLDRRSAASAGAMAGIYFRLLEHIAAAPAAVLSTRVSLSTAEKAMVAVRSLATTALRPPGIRRPAGNVPAGGGATGHDAAGNGLGGNGMGGHGMGSDGRDSNGSGARPSDGPGQATGADG